MQTVIDSLKTDVFISRVDNKEMGLAVKDLWNVQKDGDGKAHSNWLELGPFASSNDTQMSMMIGLSRFFCNDLVDRPDPPSYIGTAKFDSAKSRSGQFNPPNRLILSNWKVTDPNICCVEVDSDYVDPGFKLDLWRPDGSDTQYTHVCRIDMPLVKGLNRKVVSQATNGREGDVIGWWSSTNSEVKYADGEEGGQVRYSDGFAPSVDLEGQATFSFTTTNFFSGSFTNRVFSIRIMSDSDTWLDMQQAVLDCFPDKADKYLGMAKRTYFEDPSTITALSWNPIRDLSTSQNAIFQFPYPPPPPTEPRKEIFTYQEMIRHWSVYVGPNDTTESGTTHGRLVQQWLEANKDIILKNGDIGDWVNVVS
jgi:hypothetical protein